MCFPFVFHAFISETPCHVSMQAFSLNSKDSKGTYDEGQFDLPIQAAVNGFHRIWLILAKHIILGHTEGILDLLLLKWKLCGTKKKRTW